MVTTTWTQTAGMTSETGTDNIEDYAEQAEASKDAAAASETAAASSASAASTSASEASTDAASALSSKNAAATSETNSATSETNSASSAASASTSATNANTSASNSASSATASASSASAASTSETNASTSAAAALASENAAAASQAASSSSEAASAASETAAASSETAAASSATAAQTAQAAAEAAEASTEALFDQFGDQYLGPKASDPTVDNDGNPLVEGAVYFNTTDDVLKFYSGSAWVAPESIATTAATAAQAAQAAAETAETNASSSASSAASSASSASSSASAAATSASEAATNAASVNLNSIDIDGGTIDGTVIGGSVPAAGSFTTGSFTGNVTFGDNVKATFGASADLQIYHDGSHSYVQDVGSGNLRLKSQNFQVIGNADNEAQIETYQNGGVYLYHNGSEKLATTSSGIDVTGTVVADGLTIGTTLQSSLFYLYGAPQATSGALATFRDSAASSSNTSFGSLVFSSSPGTDYAIGKSNVNSATTLSFRNANTGASYVDIDSSGNLEMTGGGSVGWANWTITESGGSLYFATGGTNKMKLDASGNLDVVGSVNSNATIS